MSRKNLLQRINQLHRDATSLYARIEAVGINDDTGEAASLANEVVELTAPRGLDSTDSNGLQRIIEDAESKLEDAEDALAGPGTPYDADEHDDWGHW
jgi:hypothetical protein